MIFDLTREIAKFLEEKLSGLYSRVPNKGQDEVLEPPKIFIGALPPKVPNEHEHFPFVIVRPSKGSEDGEERSEVTVTLVCGVFTAESIEGGFNDLCNLVSRINISLLGKKILGGRYALELPITWQAGGEDENQPHPHYVASIKTKWLIPAMLPENLEEIANEY